MTRKIIRNIFFAIAGAIAMLSCGHNASDIVGIYRNGQSTISLTSSKEISIIYIRGYAGWQSRGKYDYNESNNELLVNLVGSLNREAYDLKLPIDYKDGQWEIEYKGDTFTKKD